MRLLVVLLVAGSLDAQASHLIKPPEIRLTGGGLLPCPDLSSEDCVSNVSVRTTTWTDTDGKEHPDGCTATSEYGIFEYAQHRRGNFIWTLVPKDNEAYYFDPVIGATVDAKIPIDKALDLDVGAAVNAGQGFRLPNRNKRPRDNTGATPESRPINIHFNVYRVRPAQDKTGPELCGSVNPVIVNLGD